jgi:hypothetical protein
MDFSVWGRALGNVAGAIDGLRVAPRGFLTERTWMNL